MPELKPKCVECGSTDGAVQHVDIAWPGAEPFFIEREIRDHESPSQALEYVPNPKVGRRFWSGWLHMECEMICIERIERKMAAEKATKK
jgi:hypothetical protein